MEKKEVIVFGGGCFWCTEAVFKRVQGVHSAVPDYAGGTTANPTYEEVLTGKTGHAEVVKIEYDPSETNFRDLLTVFFGSHDPTTLNRQGADVGPQYRSVVLYTTPEQKKETEAFVEGINASSRSGESVVTEIAPLGTFYPAEDYHRDYFEKNPGAVYCQLVINPKLEKVQRELAALMRR